MNTPPFSVPVAGVAGDSTVSVNAWTSNQPAVSSTRTTAVGAAAASIGADQEMAPVVGWIPIPAGASTSEYVSESPSGSIASTSYWNGADGAFAVARYTVVFTGSVTISGAPLAGSGATRRVNDCSDAAPSA